MPLKASHNIERIDHHYFHGYLVRVKRRGEVYERYFADNGNRRAALQSAVRFRDQLLPTLPPPRRFHNRGANNTTGVIGVSLRDERSRKGTRVRGYRALWTDESGRSRSRTFSVLKYGEARAFSLAEETRRSMLEELLRPERPRTRPLIPPRSL